VLQQHTETTDTSAMSVEDIVAADATARRAAQEVLSR
jgi:hypothetical protein